MQGTVSAVKARLRGTPFYTPIETAYRSIYKTVHRCRRVVLHVDQTLAGEHLTQPTAKKLHLGCGNHLIEGWLNCDFLPYSEQVMRLDVTERFPFPDSTFDYAFSEHMIEHIPYPAGQHMLDESFRVLKPGGKIRITTPDLAFLIALYQTEKTDLQKRYVQWATESLAPALRLDTFVINNFVRAWGHQFIYDEKALGAALRQAGFQDITRCALNESSSETFRNLENEDKIPAGFLKLESFTLEGTKHPS